MSKVVAIANGYEITNFLIGPKAPPYLTYLTLIENIMIVIFHLISLIFMSRVVFCYALRRHYLRVSTIAPTMLLFLCTHILSAIMEMPYHAYAVIKWNPSEFFGGILEQNV